MSFGHQNGNVAENGARTEQALSASELSYRRLFEAAKDGILILDFATGCITDANPFLCKLLGFTLREMVGQTVGELSPFKDIVSNQAMFKLLQEHGYVRYEDLPLKTKDGRNIAVEFVSNVYQAGDKQVIQCNVRDITERKQTEEALHDFAATQSSILNALPAQVALIDKEGVIVSVNEAWRRFAVANELNDANFGVGQNYLDVCERSIGNWSENAQAVARGIHRVLDGETEDFTMEYPCHSPTVQRWFLLRVVPKSEGSLAGAVVMHVNITERKLAEEALHSSESNMAGAQRIAHVGSWAVEMSNPTDFDANPLHWSDEVFRIAGYEPGKVEPSIKLFFQLVPEDELGLIRDAIAAAIASRKTLSIVHRLIRPNGEERTVQEVGQVFFDEKDGQPFKIVGTIQDITERDQIEKVLYESKQLLEGILNAMPVRVFWKDKNLNYLGCNALFARDAGFDAPKDIIGKDDFQMGWHNQAELYRSDDRQVIESGNSKFLIEESQTTPAGDTIALLSSKVPLRNSEGETYGMLGTYIDITERKKTEEHLQLQGRALEAAANAIVITDSKGVIEWANPAFTTYTGYSVTEAIGQNPRLLNSGKQDEKFYRKLWETILAGKVWHGEMINRRKDGTLYDEDMTITPMRDINGEIAHFIAVKQDITKRKEAEEQLHWKTAFLEAQINSSPDGILIVDSEGKKVHQNQRMADLWNIPRDIADETDDQRQREWVISQVKNSRQFAEKIANLEAHPDEIIHAEVELIDGRIIDRYSAPVLGNDGKRYGRIRSFRDITERKQAEEQISEQAAFLDKARDAIIVRDLDGKLLYWNKGAEHIYGWTSQEALGRNVLEILGTDPKKFEELNGVTINHGEWNGEILHLTKDRREMTVESRCTLICDKEGHPKSVLAINTDITERKKMEAQFLRAQRMESIGTLAGGIAHDLNNILAPIMMSIELLKETSSDPQSTKMLETIEVSAQRGADIVRQVLSFARGMEGERIEVQPKHLLKDLESIIKNTFPKDIRLQFSIPNDTWTILGDPTQVQQILLNLCVNARDAMSHGGILSVGVENCVLDEQYAAMNLQAKPGRYVTISVTDSGTGMPPGVIDKIFDPFFTTKELSKGTGLGLSTVLGIVKSHEGIINVYSEPGKGTTFRVYLPAMELSSKALEKQVQPVIPPRGNGETILVVDDEVSILIITSQTLESFGYRVLTATNGAAAVAVYARHMNEIAMVLTDIAMPIMDGPTTIHALKEINPAVKIIAASGLHANGDPTQASVEGVKHFLTKPYSAATLLKTMRAILDEV